MSNYNKHFSKEDKSDYQSHLQQEINQIQKDLDNTKDVKEEARLSFNLINLKRDLSDISRQKKAKFNKRFKK